MLYRLFPSKLFFSLLVLWPQLFESSLFFCCDSCICWLCIPFLTPRDRFRTLFPAGSVSTFYTCLSNLVCAVTIYYWFLLVVWTLSCQCIVCLVKQKWTFFLSLRGARMIPESDQIFTEVELGTLEKAINETMVNGLCFPFQEVAFVHSPKVRA